MVAGPDQGGGLLPSVRLAILSDIHGNLPALEAVLEHMQATPPDHIIVAGDSVNGAGFSAEVMDRITAPGWTAIRGNHDYILLKQHLPEWSNHPFIPYLMMQLADKLPILATMPDSLTLRYPGLPAIRVEHGFPGYNTHAIHHTMDDADALIGLKSVEESIYIAGHFHIAFERQMDRWRVFNPGPVGLPQDGIRQANYLILDGADGTWTPTFHRVDYDFSRVEARLREQNLVGWLGRGRATLRLEVLRDARPWKNAYLRWRDHHHPNTGYPIDLVDAFLALPIEKRYTWLYPPYQVNRQLL
jgi:putative phosphoesterase